MRRILFVLILVLSFTTFYNFLSTYFFQDDFFVLSVTRVENVSDLLHFLIPRGDVQFYRPLSHELFYFLGRKILGWNPAGFHAVVFLVFSASIIFFYKIAEYFLKNRINQLFAVFLFATSAIHYNSLNWIANFSYILVALFYFWAFLWYLKHKELWKISCIYILGLLSNEFMITFPLLLFFHMFLFNKIEIKKRITLLFILIVITGTYLIYRFIFFPPEIGSYRYIFGKEMATSYRYFFLFFLNFPETIKDQLLTFYKIKDEFWNSFRLETSLFLVNSFSMLGLFLIPVMFVFRKQKILKKEYKKMLFFLFWVVICLLPIVGIPHHASPHQGILAFAGFILLLLSPLDLIKKEKIGLLTALIFFSGIIWVYSSVLNIRLNDNIHWIKRRSDIVKYWITKAESQKNSIKNSSTIIIGTDDKETKVALKDGIGIKEYFGKSDIEVIFSKEKIHKGKIIIK